MVSRIVNQKNPVDFFYISTNKFNLKETSRFGDLTLFKTSSSGRNRTYSSFDDGKASDKNKLAIFLFIHLFIFLFSYMQDSETPCQILCKNLFFLHFPIRGQDLINLFFLSVCHSAVSVPSTHYHVPNFSPYCFLSRR